MNKLKTNHNTWSDDEDDDLSNEISVAEGLTNLPKLPEELIEGIVRVGHKMLISGASKAGKSFLLMELTIALSEGLKWLGFQCRKSKVLYINLEIDPNSIYHRFFEIYRAMKIKPLHSNNVSIWNLRGYAMPLDKLAPILIRRVANKDFDVIIIDPIYKVITGDENNASDMGYFTNQFDKICLETGCTVIFSHHHSKGSQGLKRAMDRASGSGVFARDPDAQIDMIQLDISEVFLAQNADNESSTAWRLESSLREFPNFKPVNFWFEYPIHRIDDKDILKQKYADGDPRANLEKSGKRKQTPESRKEVFDVAFNACKAGEDYCTTDELSNYLGIGIRTIQKRVVEFEDDYLISKGNVYRKETIHKTKKGS